MREDIDYRLVDKGGDTDIQHVAIAIGDTTFAGMYVSPSVQGHKLHKVIDRLEWLKQLTPGRICVAGDLNARHKKWDRTQNQRGRELHRWCSKHC